MDILQNTLSFQNLHGTLNRTHELIDPKNYLTISKQLVHFQKKNHLVIRIE